MSTDGTDDDPNRPKQDKSMYQMLRKCSIDYALSPAYLQCLDFYEDIKSTFFVIAVIQKNETEPKWDGHFETLPISMCVYRLPQYEYHLL